MNGPRKGLRTDSVQQQSPRGLRVRARRLSRRRGTSPDGAGRSARRIMRGNRIGAPADPLPVTTLRTFREPRSGPRRRERFPARWAASHLSSARPPSASASTEMTIAASSASRGTRSCRRELCSNRCGPSAGVSQDRGPETETGTQVPRGIRRKSLFWNNKAQNALKRSRMRFHAACSLLSS